MEPENVLKGRMAESLVDQLLRKAEFRVYRFGYEAVLQNLTQTEEKVLGGNDDITLQIRSIPDFLVVKKQPYFVEVKFRSSGKMDLEMKMLERINQFWKAKVIFVTTSKPYFRVLTPPYFDSKKHKPIMKPLDEDEDLKIPKSILPEFEKLVEQYFKK